MRSYGAPGGCFPAPAVQEGPPVHLRTWSAAVDEVFADYGWGMILRNYPLDLGNDPENRVGNGREKTASSLGNDREK